MKKTLGDIIILQQCTMIICYTFPEIWYVTDVINFILGHFLPFHASNSLKNQN